MLRLRVNYKASLPFANRHLCVLHTVRATCYNRINMQKISLIVFLTTVTLSAGCFTPPASINIATPLSELNTGNNIPQKFGFGEIPSAPTVDQTNARININTDLPSLQPFITVLRLPPNALDEVQFQNLTTSMGMPAGLIGKDAKNLELSFSWTNSANEVWSYDSSQRRLTYANASQSPENTVVSSWPSDQLISDAVDDFMINRGSDPLSYRNAAIQKDWREWLRKIRNEEACVSQANIEYFQKLSGPKAFLEAEAPQAELNNCTDNTYPSRIPVTFDLVIDDKNIMDEKGKSEIGGYIIFNASTLEVEYAWITLAATPARSDYPAITAQQMRQNMLNGGLGGQPQGTVEINETFFAFYRLDTGDEYSYKYLVPALVGSGTQTISGTEAPYNIVVPLTK